MGKKIKIRLSNNTEIPAEITNVIKEESEEVLLILKIEKQIQELINYRKISFDLIWWDASGLKVPNQAIVEVDDLHYVVRNRARLFEQNISKNKKTRGKIFNRSSLFDRRIKRIGVFK